MFSTTVIVYIVAAVGLFVVVLLNGNQLTGHAAREWVIFAALAIFPGLLGHTLINWSLGYLNSNLVSISLLGEPIGAAILAILLFAEVPTTGTLFGGALVLCGIYLTAVDTKAT